MKDNKDEIFELIQEIDTQGVGDIINKYRDYDFVSWAENETTKRFIELIKILRIDKQCQVMATALNKEEDLTLVKELKGGADALADLITLIGDLISHDPDQEEN